MAVPANILELCRSPFVDVRQRAQGHLAAVLKAGGNLPTGILNEIEEIALASMCEPCGQTIFYALHKARPGQVIVLDRLQEIAFVENALHGTFTVQRRFWKMAWERFWVVGACLVDLLCAISSWSKLLEYLYYVKPSKLAKYSMIFCTLAGMRPDWYQNTHAPLHLMIYDCFTHMVHEDEITRLFATAINGVQVIMEAALKTNATWSLSPQWCFTIVDGLRQRPPRPACLCLLTCLSHLDDSALKHAVPMGVIDACMDLLADGPQHVLLIAGILQNFYAGSIGHMYFQQPNVRLRLARLAQHTDDLVRYFVQFWLEDVRDHPVLDNTAVMLPISPILLAAPFVVPEGAMNQEDAQIDDVRIALPGPTRNGQRPAGGAEYLEHVVQVPGGSPGSRR